MLMRDSHPTRDVHRLITFSDDRQRTSHRESNIFLTLLIELMSKSRLQRASACFVVHSQVYTYCAVTARATLRGALLFSYTIIAIERDMLSASLVASLFLQNIVPGGVICTYMAYYYTHLNTDQNGIHTCIVYVRRSNPYNNITLITIFCRLIEISL